MFSRIAIFCAILVAVSATAHLGAVVLNHAAPVKTVVSTHYASHAVPVAVAHAPVAYAHTVPVAVAHVAPAGYSKSYESKYFGTSKYAVAHGSPISYSTHSEVNHGHGKAIVVQHAAPVVVAHAAPLAVKPVVYRTGLLGHGLLGHQLGRVVYNGQKYIHY